jgi:hypothetical protein
VTPPTSIPPARLGDNELLGAVSAARRLAARAEYLELTAVAEFTRRQDARYAAAVAAKVPPGRRDGEFADAELGMELVTSGNAARDRMDMADHLRRRLPATNAALAAGLIDRSRARIIWRHTRVLSDAGAAHADQVLAGAAPHLRYETRQGGGPPRRAAGRGAPRGVRQRVPQRPRTAGRGRAGGQGAHRRDGRRAAHRRPARHLRQLRALAYTDLTQGRNPLDRLTRPGPGETANDSHPDRTHTGDQHPGDADTDTGQAGGGSGADKAGAQAGKGRLDEDPYAGDGTGPGDSPGAPARDPAPFPALINLTIPAATLLGFSGAPGDIGGWGLADCDDARRLARAAARHPATRWCATITGPDGTATAHGCARGPQPRIPPPAPGPGSTAPGQRPGGGGTRGGPATRDPTTHPGSGPDPGQAAALTGLLQRLNLTLHPIARGTCDHRHREDRYTPSRKLGHLVRARTATCPAPGCGAQACHNDLDHTLAYPAGPTDECNFGPQCMT